MVFCDGNTCEDQCEPHAHFQVDAGGGESITLWGPEGDDGGRTIIDQVWLPPLRADVSFGRFPDGAGPAPVPIEETFDHFVFSAVGETSFGNCISIPGTACGVTCLPLAEGEDPPRRRFCEGAENAGPGNLEPRVSRLDHSTNAPSANEDVEFTVEVRDDKLPIPGNIVSVRIEYRVDGGESQFATLEYLDNVGVIPDISGLEPGDPDFPLEPLDRRTLWRGTIPGQPAGSRVQFILRVEDKEGLESTRPRNLCDFGVGPCGRDFGSPEDPGFGNDDECTIDPLSTSCEGRLTGVRFVSCDAWFSYVSGYSPRAELDGLVINEVVAVQSSVEQDPTSDPGSSHCQGPNPPNYCCFGTDGEPAPLGCGFEDYAELYNASDSEIDLSGLWLANSYFQPRGWQFPPGSTMAPGSYCTVWLDNDGGECPDPDLSLDERPCFWECPDPNDPAVGRYHASFTLDGSGDQLFLFDDAANDHGLVHGVEFVDQVVDEGLALCPNGERTGQFVATDTPTFEAENDVSSGCGGEESFRRGDATADGGIDLSDGVSILNWLFLGGPQPPCQDAADTNDSGGIDLSDAVSILNFLFLGGVEPAPPGPTDPGVDPTPDDLPPCVYDAA